MEWGIQKVPAEEIQETSQTAELERRVKEKGSCTANELNDANSPVLSGVGQGTVLHTKYENPLAL